MDLITYALCNKEGGGSGDGYSKEEINNLISSVYKFKGSVATYNDLPSSDQVVGDVYNVESDGSNYAWDGTNWDKLSEDIDLTNYAKKSDIPTKTSDLTNDSGFLTQHQDLSGKADKATTLSGYGITDAQSLINNNNTISSDFVNDTNANNKFTTTTEKNTWNNKYDKPANGIPKTDLAQDVQTALDKTVDSSFIEDSSNPVESQVIQDALNGKVNFVAEQYSNVDNCLRPNTIYLIENIPLENDGISNGILFCARIAGMGTTQYLFDKGGQILYRYKAEGSTWSDFSDIFANDYQSTSYKSSQILENAEPGYNSNNYPTVGAVKEYVKAYYQSALESIPENISAFNNDEGYKTTAYDEMGNITTNNVGWYTTDNGGTATYLTGTYRLIDDLCIIAGYAEVKSGWNEMWYSLPVAAVQGAAAVAMDGGDYYCIGTSLKDNISVMRITKMNGQNFSQDAIIHFVLTYKCQN